jgi:Fur family ferric uptake transcriptional regulator
MAQKYLKGLAGSEGLKATRQREEIFKIFLGSPGHQNIAQIHARVAKVNPKIGYTTVYRTLKLLTRLGLAVARKFGEGETRYERAHEGRHHDHLICMTCGAIIEFEDPVLEALQNKIAEQYRFKSFYPRMELYGQCARCALPKERRGNNQTR